jgi:hypothetical protein
VGPVAVVDVSKGKGDGRFITLDACTLGMSAWLRGINIDTLTVLYNHILSV